MWNESVPITLTHASLSRVELFSVALLRLIRQPTKMLRRTLATEVNLAQYKELLFGLCILQNRIDLITRRFFVCRTPLFLIETFP